VLTCSSQVYLHQARRCRYEAEIAAFRKPLLGHQVHSAAVAGTGRCARSPRRFSRRLNRKPDSDIGGRPSDLTYLAHDRPVNWHTVMNSLAICREIIKASSRAVPPPLPETHAINDKDGSRWSADDMRDLQKALKHDWIEDEEHAHLLVRTTRAVLFTAYAGTGHGSATDAWRLIWPYFADEEFRSSLWSIYQIHLFTAVLGQAEAMQLLMEAHESTLPEEPDHVADAEAQKSAMKPQKQPSLADLLEPRYEPSPALTRVPVISLRPSAQGVSTLLEHNRRMRELLMMIGSSGEGKAERASIFQDFSLEAAEPLFQRSVLEIVSQAIRHFK